MFLGKSTNLPDIALFGSDVSTATLLGLTGVLAVLCVVLGAFALNRHNAFMVTRNAERSFRTLYENIGEGVFRSTLDGRMISANPALVRLNGFATEEEMLNEVNDIAGQWYVDPNRRAEIHQMLVEHGRVSGMISEVHRYKTRERIWIEENTRLVSDEKTGNALYYDGTVREVTETIRRQQLQDRYDKITSVVSGCLYQLRMKPDGSTSFPYASRGLTQIYGVRPEEVADDGSILSALVHPDDVERVRESFARAAGALRPRQDEYRVRARDGVEKWILGHSVPEAEADGSVLWHGYFVDISERKRSEARIYDLAYFDTLTGLPNRASLLDRLRDTLVASERNGCWGALLFIDLDQFKVLNDTKGHHVGDRLLCEVAARLQPLVGGQGIVARLGGDEFVVKLRDLGLEAPPAKREVARLGDEILSAIAKPFVLDGFPFHTTASIGVALFRGEEQGVDELLKRADLAMYQAKAAGRGSISFFAPAMQAEADERLALTTELRDALEEGRLTLAYQPQVNDSGACFGAEVLLRWDHPIRGPIEPGDFIPLAERAGFAGQIDAMVLTMACATLRRWQKDPATRDLHLAVNVGAQQLRNGFVAKLAKILRATGANPNRLVLELTEHVMLDDFAQVAGVMAGLKELGVRIALDDFGTGYSSLSYLKRLPIDTLKIDCSFVREIESDPNDRAIVQTILTMAVSLGVSAIAEGVENHMQALLLRQFGCHAYQGYFFGRPMTLEAFEARLATAEPAPVAATG